MSIQNNSLINFSTSSCVLSLLKIFFRLNSIFFFWNSSFKVARFSFLLSQEINTWSVSSRSSHPKEQLGCGAALQTNKKSFNLPLPNAHEWKIAFVYRLWQILLNFLYLNYFYISAGIWFDPSLISYFKKGITDNIGYFV